MGQRRGLIIGIVGLGLAILGIIVVTNLVRRAATPPAPPTPVPPITIQVVVTTHDIPIKTLLTADDLAQIEIPLELSSFEYVSSVEEVAGRITKIPLVSGEIVYQHHLADPTNISENFAFIIEDDQVLMAFPAKDLMSEVDVLQPGDMVDILASVEQPVFLGETGLASQSEGEETQPEDVLFTFNAIQQIEISAIVVELIPQQRGTTSARSATASSQSGETNAEAEPTPTPQPSEIEAHAILLAVDPQDALVLKHIKDNEGIFDIVLRSPTSKQIFTLKPVTSDYLRDRYELVIER